MFGLSQLGMIHTFISLVAVAAAIIMLLNEGLIDPHGRLGKVYLVCTALGCLTAFGLLKHGLNPGHALALITLLCLVGAVAAERFELRGWRYTQVILLSTSLFFSLIPAVNETLTRLPLAHPLATGPQDPLVGKSLGILAALFIVTLSLQIFSARKAGAGVGSADLIPSKKP